MVAQALGRLWGSWFSRRKSGGITPNEVRAALLENGVLQEVYIERAARRGLEQAVGRVTEPPRIIGSMKLT